MIGRGTLGLGLGKVPHKVPRASPASLLETTRELQHSHKAQGTRE